MALITEVQVNGNDSDVCGDEDTFIPWDNPDNVITAEMFAAARNILICYFNAIIFCIGVPANVLSCVVFFRQGLYILL